MCPISFPICLPYWFWVVLVLFGLTSTAALYCMLGILVVILMCASYIFYKKGNTVVNSVRKAVGGLVNLVGVVVCKVGCVISKVGEMISGKDPK